MHFIILIYHLLLFFTNLFHFLLISILETNTYRTFVTFSLFYDKLILSPSLFFFISFRRRKMNVALNYKWTKLSSNTRTKVLCWTVNTWFTIQTLPYITQHLVKNVYMYLLKLKFLRLWGGHDPLLCPHNSAFDNNIRLKQLLFQHIFF